MRVIWRVFSRWVRGRLIAGSVHGTWVRESVQPQLVEMLYKYASCKECEGLSCRQGGTGWGRRELLALLPLFIV